MSGPAGHCLDATVFTTDLDGTQEHWLRERWLHPPLPGGGTRRLILRGVPQLPATPHGAAQAVAVGTETVSVRIRGSQVWLGATLWLDVADPAQVSVQVTFQVDEQACSEAVWWLALAEAHRVAGWLPLHAALVTGDGGAAAISGVSGAGKSTAALRLLGAGHRLLAEDQTWVRGADALATGLDHCLRAYPDSVTRFAPQLLTAARDRDIHGKLMLPVIRPGQVATLRQVLLLSDAGAAPMSRADQVRALWEASGVPLTSLGRQAAAQAASVLLQKVKVTGTSRGTVLAQVAEMLPSSSPFAG